MVWVCQWLQISCSTNWATEELYQDTFFYKQNNILFGGHAQNRTGIQGFAILCVTIPPRGQVALWSSSRKQQLDFIHLHIISTSMKVENKTIKVDQELTRKMFSGLTSRIRLLINYILKKSKLCAVLAPAYSSYLKKIKY